VPLLVVLACYGRAHVEEAPSFADGGVFDFGDP